MIDDLIIKYLNYKVKKRNACRHQQWNLASKLRDNERIIIDEICKIIDSNYKWENWKISEEIIDKYCLSNYKCSVYDSKMILRDINLKKLGI
jgi:hypothetical protein